jgi:hypothetical protein
MTNLLDTIAALDTLAEAYKRRSGFGKVELRTADELYNAQQFGAFANAADMLRRTIVQHDEYHAAKAPAFEVVAEFEVAV